ncbi:MAG: hypothetical protein ABIR46_01775 [Candidatus Saccharimonadales bacterium]
MLLVPKPRESSLYQAYESYNNPRLADDGANYLTPDHIEELRKNSEIVIWDEYAPPVSVPGIGTLKRIGIQTKQGYTYDTLVGIPERPECTVPIIGTTAWTTSLRGHNERLVRNMMRAGNYIFFVGHEGSYIPQESTKPCSPISLANSAAAVLNFSYHMANELRKKNHDIDPVQRLGLGESRGAMIAEGLDALAGDFGQEMIFIDEIAPCLPEKLNSLHDFYKLGEQIAKEPLEMYRLLGKLTLSRLRYYPKTIDIHLDCLRHQVMIGGALFSGETGALARHVPDTTLKHISLFNNDFASDHLVWQNIYHDHPLTRIVTLPGSHMTIGDLQTMRYVLARNKVTQESINSGTELTKANVFDIAHTRVPYEFPLGPEFQSDIFNAA